MAETDCILRIIEGNEKKVFWKDQLFLHKAVKTYAQGTNMHKMPATLLYLPIF